MKLKFYFSTLVIVLMANINSFAQTLCNGETIKFRETFGSGNTTSLPSGRTTYSYNSNSYLNDGDYKLSKKSQGRPEWHDANDHTGNNNGRMMVINAGYTAAEFYKDTVTGLTPGSDYSVYLYVMNVNTLGTCGVDAILPKLQFVVEYLSANNSYQTLTSFTSNFIQQSSNPTWVKVSSGFTLPNGITTVRYKIINNSNGGCGNDLALDDITFSQCSSLSSLPVKDLRINNMEAKADGVHIQFSTLSEYDTKDMQTQRSLDGINWKTIHTQPAAGSSDQYKAYTALDMEQFNQPVYYRILQTDNNGSYSYSSVVKFQGTKNTALTLSTYPNPASSEVSLNISSPVAGTATISLYSANGSLVQRQHIQVKNGTTLAKMNLSSLSKGMYMITLENANNQTISQKLIKN
ncbi:MAG TPA: T9SS type A sorting domain-containing protein [Chitinophagaceae bacterium]|nr:T9SS type A sorting domain-containing protein [Chitinophagaceae bacterium]